MPKYLVYTCVTNNYDKVRNISRPQDPNIDFVCFTDKINKSYDLREKTGWMFMPIPEELRDIDCRRQARLIKICIYKYLKGYDGYLWIDAPIIIIGNIGEFIKEHPFSENCGLYVSKHYMRDCAYQEFIQVVRLNKDRTPHLYDQLNRYKKMGYPEHNGMAETSLLYRNFKDLKIQTHASVWADEIINYSYRDQLSFNWAAWSTRTNITYLNEDIYKRDTQSETSKYFFLPWPKHNNPNVVKQLEARLNINKQQSTITPDMEEFEKEYQKFIEKLKAKSAAKEKEKNKVIEKSNVEISSNQIIEEEPKEKPKKSKRKKKISK